MSTADLYRVTEVLVQMINELNDTVFQRARYRQVVKDRKMLHVLTKADTSSVRAYWDPEFCCHQNNGKVFIDTGDTAAVDLAYIDRVCLHQLLEHHPIMAMFTGCDSN